MSVNIDTVIAAWKSARTQADRDLAAEAIEQHIAHETPEGADYESATEELIDRLKAEFGPVPVEDIRQILRATDVRHFIAVPAVEANQTAIFGLGNTAEEAVADAYAEARTQVPTIETGTAPSRYVDGETEQTWTVTTTQSIETFYSEAEADRHVEANSFVAQECTERLFLSVQKGSVNRWTTSGRLQDLDVDQGAVDEALDEVKKRLIGDHEKIIADLDAEDALYEANLCVDSTIGQNGTSDYHDAISDNPEFRLALDLAVRDHLLELIAEREAA
ncbi:hypothetical protein [Methylobacterium oryzae]|uniref:hypothetical protein n=1 Tax=Methylobacterium oryzae TaxID=334852 RepID=UPI001F397AB8|nr:hypothetical protein [Methylobacterium oryzae]UIN36832.1 hypothetical protein LXM90_10180 [Methylobacterium oryzae]